MTRSLAELGRIPSIEWTKQELEIIKAAHGLSSREHRQGAKDGLVLQSFAEIEPEPLLWLWPSVVPLGKITLLVGDPGLGKSLLTSDMAARVSRGAPWPDDSKCQLGGVLLLSAEDDPGDTIRPRLDAAGALPQMIDYVIAVREGKKERSFNLEVDVERLDKTITDETALVVIDPITAYLGGTDSHVTSDVRGLLAPLAELAARRGVAIVGVSHLNKSSGPAMYRITGSLAFVAAARAVWAVGRDKQDESRILMLPVKQNLAKNDGGFAYRIETVQTSSEIVAPRVVWENGRVQGNATELLQTGRDGEESSRQAQAADWLLNRLSDGEEAAVNGLTKEAEAEGLDYKVLWRAAKKLAIKMRREGFGKDSRRLWSLPIGSRDSIDSTDSVHGKYGMTGKSGMYGGPERTAEKDLTI